MVSKQKIILIRKRPESQGVFFLEISFIAILLSILYFSYEILHYYLNLLYREKLRLWIQNTKIYVI